MMGEAHAAGTSVVLEVRRSQPSAAILAAVVEIAQAFDAPLTSLFVEDEALRSLACLPCAREVALSGRHSHGLTLEKLETDFKLAFGSIRHEIEARTRRASVRLEQRFVRGDPERALQQACGAGAVVALAEPLASLDGRRLDRIVSGLDGAAGYLVAGARARHRAGPLAVLLEREAAFAPLVATARRLLSRDHAAIDLVFAAASRPALDAMLARAQRLRAVGVPVRIVELRRGAHVETAMHEAVDRAGAGLLIGALDGMLSPRAGLAATFIGGLTCPLLLLR